MLIDTYEVEKPSLGGVAQTLRRSAWVRILGLDSGGRVSHDRVSNRGTDHIKHYSITTGLQRSR